ncbi:RNA-binding protein [Alkalithermobacter thermoalcaliphilus JW-YL-7 = DSM 7308]|uniref:RNA-binding protein n=1 Tax=Alkalithermobacter thermoalcaliphilus JW-YL-7 = DSM 7308 TaxID=1121328 RepID=A0A150FRB3_CLOPD|nr:RNA-binding, CRM domain-containing protein [[Clostridium] paradoxum JW-YL-7 = DSM 7308]SHL02974.1 RNA-binding protein [[Clostridium] paradoxum JW-YL-7 = DSM 7308]
MLTGKQRAYLKSLANGIKPITQIGKEGVTDAFLKQLDDALRARELVKVHVLENSGLDVKETANEVARLVRGEFVQAIGSKFTIYKKNREKQIIQFPK